MGVLRLRFCVDMIGGNGIHLFLVGLGYNACAGVGSVVAVVCLFIRFLSDDQSSSSGSR